MRFGMFVPQGWRLDLVGIEPRDQWRTMLRVAEHAERGPWESVWVYDHFHTTPEPTDNVTYEAWTLMAALAAATSTIRLGQMCTCMGYRNPAYLAKVAASIDVISGGRLEMGIGAGWYEHEWRAYGYGFPTAGERLAQLAEGVLIMRQLWRDGVASFTGAQYTVDGAICSPRPLQDGGVPLWVAGGGERKTLRIAAEHADYTNFFGDLEEFAHKCAVLDQHCADIGRDPREITRSGNVNILIGESAADIEDARAAIVDRIRRHAGDSVADKVASRALQEALAGTPEQVAEALAARRDAGLDYLICYFPSAAYDLSAVELFESQVIPALST